MKTPPRNRIYVLVMFLFVVFMSSCVQTQNVQIPTNTETPPPPALPSQTLTPKVSSTKTPMPPLITPNSSATFSAGVYATLASLSSRNDVCDIGFFAKDVLWGSDYYSTNSGESWMVIKCLPENSNRSKGYVKVINSDSSKIWKISYESLPLPSRYEFISGYKIDPTGNFLYLVPSNFFGWEDGCPFKLFGYGSPLYRLELSSGKISTILPYIDNSCYVVSISPDVRYLVYSDSRDGKTVNIQDLINGSSKTVKLENIYVINGGFTWTPDGKSLVFAAGVNGWEDGNAGISLFLLNLSTMKLQTLLLNDRRNLVPEVNFNWLDDNTLSLVSIESKMKIRSFVEWSINIKTGEVILH